MIVDVHTHFLNIDRDCGARVFTDFQRCGIDPESWRFSAEDHFQATAPADVAVVFGLRAACTGWQVSNDDVAAHVRQAPERLIFFAAIDPGEALFMEELERCHQELHCQGIKLGPIYQGIHPLDTRYYEIYRYCQQHGLPIMTHMATTFSSGVPLEYARPALMDQVACDFPDLVIVLAHMGHPWEAETIAAIRKQPNLYADISALYYRPWQFYNSMHLLTEYHAEKKVLFGSDFPATTTANSISGLRNVNAVLAQSGLPPVPESVIDTILYQHALSILGLQLPSPKGAVK